MPLIVQLREPQVTLQRRRRGCCSVICPKTRRCGLVQSLSLAFLSIAIASVGFLVITQVGLSQKNPIGKRLLTRLRHSSQVRTTSLASQDDNNTDCDCVFEALSFYFSGSISSISGSPTATGHGDFFKINPLLDKNAPNVQLSAQMILNSRYFVNIKRDILSYYNSVKCRLAPEKTRSTFSPTVSECKNFTLVDKTIFKKNWWAMKSCPTYPPHLRGVQYIPPRKFLSINNVDIKSANGMQSGGSWEPDNCIARHSIAIIIPYKNRWKHLTTLLSYLHPILKRQYIKHRIYVVEQVGNETFNKGSVMNAGFIEAMKDDIYQCFVFHDVDMIPENDENLYSCPQMPRHLSVAVNELAYTLPYPELVGGVLAFRTEHYFKVNGYSNFFWGWGGEDDDMAYRILKSGLPIIRPTPQLGRYTMIRHKKRKPFSRKILSRLLATSKKRYRLEGLNSVHYKLVKKTEYPWFTSIEVDLGKPHPSFKICRNQTVKN